MRDFVKRCPLLCFNILLALVIGVALAVRFLPPQHLRSDSSAASASPSSYAPPSSSSEIAAASSAVSSAAISSAAASSSQKPSSAVSSAASSGAAASEAASSDTSSFLSAASSAAAAGTTPGDMVPQKYFSDALFVGDSLTEGLSEYGDLKSAAFFCHVGLNIYQLFEEPKQDDFSNLTLTQTLKKHQYTKVYIQLGINELGTANTDYFVRHYSAAIDKIRELEPDALVFVESIFPVTKEKSDSDKVFRNSYIQERNKGLSTLANGKNTFFLDLTPVLDDGKGNMRAECSGDDVHPKAKYYPPICDQIRKTTAEALAAAGLSQDS